MPIGIPYPSYIAVIWESNSFFGHLGILRGALWMCAQVVPEMQLVRPELATCRGEVHVIAPRIASAEEVAPGNFLLSAVRVARLLERRDERPAVGLRRPACENVDDGLGAQSRNRGAPRVLEHE